MYMYLFHIKKGPKKDLFKITQPEAVGVTTPVTPFGSAPGITLHSIPVVYI